MGWRVERRVFREKVKKARFFFRVIVYRGAGRVSA
jgi:hypothetical protein